MKFRKIQLRSPQWGEICVGNYLGSLIFKQKISMKKSFSIASSRLVISCY